MNLKSYFSDLSCWEEFEMKCDLLGMKNNDPEILNCFRRIESWYFLVVGRKICFLDQNGNKVDGKDILIRRDFDISFLEIESLEGSPKKIGGFFNCSNCPNLTSLEGCPKEVKGNFWCCMCPKIPKNEIPDCEIGGDLYR